MSKYLYYLVLLLGPVPLLSHAACNRDNGDDVTVTTIPLPSKLLVSAKIIPLAKCYTILDISAGRMGMSRLKTVAGIIT